MSAGKQMFLAYSKMIEGLNLDTKQGRDFDEAMFSFVVYSAKFHLDIKTNLGISLTRITESFDDLYDGAQILGDSLREAIEIARTGGSQMRDSFERFADEHEYKFDWPDFISPVVHAETPTTEITKKIEA